jgi:predicted transcriptional regulator
MEELWNKGYKIFGSSADQEEEIGNSAESAMRIKLHITDDQFIHVGRSIVADFLKKKLRAKWNKTLNKYRKKLGHCEYIGPG